MIVRLEQDFTTKDIEILIRYSRMEKTVRRIETFLAAMDTRLKCLSDGAIKIVDADSIYYLESIDKRTFVYCEHEVYRSELRLYQLAEQLSPAGFVQISKSCILNISVLDSLKPLLNSRMEAILNNGERLLVTRKYLEDIKKTLQAEVI